MYITMEYARIVCSKCKKEVARIMPGQTFEALPICKCFEKKKRKKVVKNEKDI